MAKRTQAALDPNRTHRVGDFAVIGFGRGTQFVHVIGETEKRIEIVRCQSWKGHAHCSPNWDLHTSKISRTDKRLELPTQKPAYLPDPPTRERLAEAAAYVAMREDWEQAIVEDLYFEFDHGRVTARVYRFTSSRGERVEHWTAMRSVSNYSRAEMQARLEALAHFRGVPAPTEITVVEDGDDE